jgi:imidazolonepropionase-like amidohydrolase
LSQIVAPPAGDCSIAPIGSPQIQGRRRQLATNRRPNRRVVFDDQTADKRRRIVLRGFATRRPSRERGDNAGTSGGSIMTRFTNRTMTALVIVLLAGVLLAPARMTAQQQRRYGGGERDPQPAKATLAIVGGMLIDGTAGIPVPHSLILIDGNKIVAVGTKDTLKVPPGAKIIDAGGMTVMPGLIDAHVHMDTIGHTDYQYWHQTYRGRIQDIYAISSKHMLFSGVTTALDLGGKVEDLAAYKKKLQSGAEVGVRLKSSMGFITDLSESYVATWHRGYQTINVHNPEDARGAALKYIAAGAEVLKAYTGLNGAEVKAIADEAHANGLWVTGHAEGIQNTIDRLKAGQDAIEHTGGYALGGKVPDEVINLMLTRRTWICPTLVTNGAQIDAVEWPEFWTDSQRMKANTPPEIWADIRRSLDYPNRVLTNFGGFVHWRSADESKAIFQQLYHAGVRLLVGTDASTPLNFKTDALIREMDLMVRYGVPPMEVIGMATRVNAEYMKMGSQIGTVTAGKLADIIVVDGNPLQDMRDLRNVSVVVKDGKVVKGAAADGTPGTNPTSQTKSGGNE